MANVLASGAFNQSSYASSSPNLIGGENRASTNSITNIQAY